MQLIWFHEICVLTSSYIPFYLSIFSVGRLQFNVAVKQIPGKFYVGLACNADWWLYWCVITTLILSSTRNGRIQAEYEQYIAELELAHKQALVDAQKRSVNTNRAVLKGKMAEQFAPFCLSSVSSQ